MFPNLSVHWLTRTIRVWQPRGPDKMEIWSWAVVDKAATAEIKDVMRFVSQYRFSPSGVFEQDDAENWVAATAAAAGTVSKRLPYNYQMRMGRLESSEDHPGVIGPSPNEQNQRFFYKRWAELMSRD